MTTPQPHETSQSICLVGDRFAGFAAHPGVKTVSQLVRSIRNGELDNVPALRVLTGQGVEPFDWDYLTCAFRRRGLLARVSQATHDEPLAARHEVHKHRQSNILLRGLHRIDGQTFAATLRLHNDNELLLDRQSGQHVQGMVAIEASRQMFLAVTERFYAEEDGHEEATPHYYFVINSMATTFENFLFPLEAQLRYIVRDLDLTDRHHISFTATIEIIQAGRRAAVTEVDFTAFEYQGLETREHRRGQKALEAFLPIPLVADSPALATQSALQTA